MKKKFVVLVVLIVLNSNTIKACYSTLEHMSRRHTATETAETLRALRESKEKEEREKKEKTQKLIKTLEDALAKNESVSHFCNLTDPKNALFQLAQSDEYIEITKKILKSGIMLNPYTLQPYQKYSPLHGAVQNLAVETTKELLRHGILPNTYDTDAETPLYKICNFSNDSPPQMVQKRITIARVLLANKADPNAINGHFGYTPNPTVLFPLLAPCLDRDRSIEQLAIPERKSLFDLLFKAGIKIHIENSQNITAMQKAYAELGTIPEFVELINYVFQREREKVLKILRKPGKGPKAYSPFKLLPLEVCEMIISFAYPEITLKPKNQFQSSLTKMEFLNMFKEVSTETLYQRSLGKNA